MNKTNYTKNEWSIIESGFDPNNQEASESLCSLGNGKMGQRANFEEHYSGKSLQGSYIAGIYYPDKTRVGWWKNGYPEYFAKVLNSPNWIGIEVRVNEELLDLAVWKVSEFKRELNMYTGTLERSFTAESPKGKTIKVRCKRFLSMANNEVGAIEYHVSALNFSGHLQLTPYLDGDVYNQDANYDEQFWAVQQVHASEDHAYLMSATKKLDFRAAFAMTCEYQINGEKATQNALGFVTEKQASVQVVLPLACGDTASLYKYVGVTSSLNYSPDELIEQSVAIAQKAKQEGFAKLLKAHTQVWETIWLTSDIVIEGDVEAQQGIRFNIFHLNQTYTGKDHRLNIGPKGFTGEKYGGSTYWDTEAYCLPFYLNTAPYEVSRQLLVYRYKQLDKAIENAKKLGFTHGAALYPMVTMNGEECHNEWEITFEEIHRNGAIAFAIFNYIRHSADQKYLAEYGLEVLVAIARFWSQRFTYSTDKKQYVMLGVTGPNEYENNVNNNFYTSFLANWCMKYAQEAAQWVAQEHPNDFQRISSKITFDLKECAAWEKIYNNTFLARSEAHDVYLQQEGFLDKELIPVSELASDQRPINQHWSWDRILRSCYIKQADTLQCIYLFEDLFDPEAIAKHYDFYEPFTVHESSLSPCIHSILAAKLNRMDDAYKHYLRTSRLDLDDYNKEVHEGLHITSMAGTWMSVVEGFGGLRILHDRLTLNPQLPKQWTAYAFNISFRKQMITVKVDRRCTTIINTDSQSITLEVQGIERTIPGNSSLEI